MNRRALNPDFRSPRDYLKEGLSGPDGSLRPELGGALAAALGREFLLVGIPLDLVERAAQELEVSQRLAKSTQESRAKLQEIAVRQTYQQHPLLAQLLGAALPFIKRQEELGLLARHLRRAVMLAQFERVLGPATLLERQRSERQSAVRKSRKSETHEGRSPRKPGPSR
ncbi:MAG TPA: hypothetical protein V6D47_16230 [Oscillatoriaceae cyanobacterium]